MPEIGATLREARMRARIDISEIEAQTKIRAKYLRAIENEEWDLLPGPTFVKSFLRTYAQALGLDGKALVEEFRLSHERPSESELLPISATARSGGRQRGSPQRAGPSRAYFVVVGVVGLIVLLLLVGLITGGGGSSGKHPASTTSAKLQSTTSHTSRGLAQKTAPVHSANATSSSRVALSLRASAAVYVCLLGDGGRKLIAGETLTASSPQTVYHAKHFVITLGNSSVSLFINGTPRVVPASSQPIGYSITKAGRRTLSQSQLPTCR